MIETKPWPETGIPPIYPYSKWNVLQWFLNIEGIDPTYMPASAQWWRALCWWFRNPMFNFFQFIVGVADKSIIVTGTVPVFMTTWNDAVPPTTGWKWSVIKYRWLRLPFISYAGTQWLWYAGWLPSGGRFGVKINRH